MTPFDDDDPIWIAASKFISQSTSEANANNDANANDFEECHCEYCNMNVQGIICDGNVMCSYCNSVLMRQMDYGAEWRVHTSEGGQTAGSDSVRCCPPSSMLGSIIAAAPRRNGSTWMKNANAANGNKANKVGNDIKKFQCWNSISYRQRVLNNIFDVLLANAAQNGLPGCILEDAKMLYKKISETRITRGDNRSSVIAVSIYLACLQNKVPRSIQEVATMFNLKTSSLTHALHMYKDSIPHVAAMKHTCSAVDFTNRFCSNLNLNAAITDHVRDVIQRADKLAIVCDAMPTSIVAGAIAFVSHNFNITVNKKDIAASCMIAPVTVTKMFKRLSEYKDYLLHDDKNDGIDS